MLYKQSHAILEYPSFRIFIVCLYIFIVIIHLFIYLLLLPDWHAETNHHAQAIKCVS